MTKPAVAPNVEVSVTICAKPATVFRFFADPERFAAWIGHGSTIEPKQGGALAMRSPHGPAAFGKILEWVENERIVFSWGHEPGKGLPPESSKVSITFQSVAAGTLITLVHSGLPAEATGGTQIGWRAHLGGLAHRAPIDAVGDKLTATVDTFLRAWMETDAGKRSKLLAQCFTEQGRYRDLHTSVDGRDALHAWMGFTCQLFPGCQLERTAAPTQTHQYVRFPWSARMGNGALIATGADFCELDPNGLLQNVVGFWDVTPPE